MRSKRQGAWPKGILSMRSRQQLMSKRHALRCPQTEVTPHKLHSALLTHLADVDLPCVQDFREMLTWLTQIQGGR